MLSWLSLVSQTDLVHLSPGRTRVCLAEHSRQSRDRVLHTVGTCREHPSASEHNAQSCLSIQTRHCQVLGLVPSILATHLVQCTCCSWDPPGPVMMISKASLPLTMPGQAPLGILKFPGPTVLGSPWAASNGASCTRGCPWAFSSVSHGPDRTATPSQFMTEHPRSWLRMVVPIGTRWAP